MALQPHPVTCISQGQRPRKPCWRRSCYLCHPLPFFSSLANKGVTSASPHPTWPDVAFGCLPSSDPAHGKMPSLRPPCPLPGTRATPTNGACRLVPAVPQPVARHRLAEHPSLVTTALLIRAHRRSAELSVRMAAHLSPASWHSAITSFPLCREALATTICLRPSGYQLRIFLEGARQCWHLLPGSSWAAGLWASLNPLSCPPQGDVYVSLPVWEPSAQKNKFSRCLALNLEEIGAYWERGSEGTRS